MRGALARLVHAVPGIRSEPAEGSAPGFASAGPRRVLIVGGGGREHALAWRILRDRPGSTFAIVPDTDSFGAAATVLSLRWRDLEGIVGWCRAERPDLVIVGDCSPLRIGLVDRLRAAGVPVLGATREAARVEWSKGYGAEVAAAAGVPMPRTWWFAGAAEAAAFVRTEQRPFVVKPDGIRTAWGVQVTRSVEATLEAIERALAADADDPGDGGLVLQELIAGPEVSYHLLCDGTTTRFIGAARDAKRLRDGDAGPNTDGMGAYAPVREVTPALRADVERRIAAPILAELRRRGTPFTGFLYLGLMLTADGPVLLEINARLGDPEAVVLLPLLSVDMVTAIEAMLAGRLDAVPWSDPVGAAVTVVLAAEGYGVPGGHRGGMEVLGLDAPDDPDTAIFHAGTSRQLDRWWVWGGRVADVTGFGATVAEARDRAYARAATITFEGMQLRTDIAAGA